MREKMKTCRAEGVTGIKTKTETGVNGEMEEARSNLEEGLPTQRAQAGCAKVLRQDQAWCAGGTERNREAVHG